MFHFLLDPMLDTMLDPSIALIVHVVRLDIFRGFSEALRDLPNPSTPSSSTAKERELNGNIRACPAAALAALPCAILRSLRADSSGKEIEKKETLGIKCHANVGSPRDGYVHSITPLRYSASTHLPPK
jgi:hypothetical protein